MSKFMNVSVKSKSNVVKRKDVPQFAVFMSKTGAVYANVGMRTVPPSAERAYQSVRLDNAKGNRGETAVSKNGDTLVTIIGSFTFNVELASDYASKLASV